MRLQCKLHAAGRLTTWTQLHANAGATGDSFHADPATDLFAMTSARAYLVQALMRQRLLPLALRARACAHQLARRQDCVAHVADTSGNWRQVGGRGRARDCAVLVDREEHASGAARAARALAAFRRRRLRAAMAAQMLPNAHCVDGTSTEAAHELCDRARIVLVTALDAASRDIAHQETHISRTAAQARALRALLVSVPLGAVVALSTRTSSETSWAAVRAELLGKRGKTWRQECCRRCCACGGAADACVW